MSAQPLVSIILPVYNGVRYLKPAIQSCLDQTYSNWELIIVDDASTDATSEIIRCFEAADNRVHSIRHERNRKLPAALNTGFSLARGELLTWTSDDNLFHPQALSKMINFLLTNPEISVVYTDHFFINDAGTETGERIVPPTEALLFNNAIGACFLYRRILHEKLGGYKEHFFLAEDYDFWLRASRFFRFAPLHEKLYYYRFHKLSLTATRKREIFLSHEKTLVENMPLLNWANGEELVAGYFQLARTAYKNSLFLKTFLNVIRAARVSPALALRRIFRTLRIVR